MSERVMNVTFNKDTVMQDTIRDVLATLDGVELTEEQKKEIEEEVYFTEEWGSVMTKIAEMIYKVNE